MKMLFVLILALVIPQPAAGGVEYQECKYSRRGGLILNEYQDSADPNFAGETGSDTTTTVGDSMEVDFVSAFDMLGATGTTATKKLKINDRGTIYFWDDGAATDAYTAATYLSTNPTDTPRKGYDKEKAFVTSRWFADAATLEYTFSYQHLKRTDLISGGNTVKSMCAMQRIEAILSDCDGSVTDATIANYQSETVEEALVVTFKHMDNTGASDTIYDQIVVAVTTAGRTKIILLIQDTGNGDVLAVDHLEGYLNGKYDSAGDVSGSSWQSLCASTGDAVDNSNCDCGSWNAGVYVFDVEDTTGSAAQNKECVNEVIASCGDTSLPHFLRNRYCRPWAVPVDTCREDLTCQVFNTANAGFRMVLSFRDIPPYTEAVFIDQTAFGSDTITVMTDASCQQEITNSKVTFDFDTADVATCDITLNGGVTGDLEFYIMVRDLEDTENAYLKDGYRILHGTCNYFDLPSTISQKGEFMTFPTTSIASPTGRLVDFFASTEYVYTTDPKDTKLSAGDQVYLGQDLFIMACYEEGTRNPQANAEPYGIWVSDCQVSNDPTFPADSNTIDLVDANGCLETGLTSTNAFFIEQEFLETSTAATGNNYEWCVSSGKQDAAKWLVSDDIYFRCSIHFCTNQVARDNTLTKCEDACAGATDSAASDIKKRDIQIDWANETMIVETSLRVVASLQADLNTRQRECTDTSLALSVISGLSVTLLMVVGATIVIFTKIQGTVGKTVGVE